MSSMSRMCQAELIEIVLNAQELERVSAIAIDEIALKLAQALDL